MKPDIFFAEEKVQTKHNASSSVSLVRFRINELDNNPIERGYYKKYPNPKRTGTLGSINYEWEGYRLLRDFGIKTPNFAMASDDGRDVLVTSPVLGKTLLEIDESEIGLTIDALLSDHLKMWQNSSPIVQSDAPIFQKIRRVDPIEEAIKTGNIFEGELMKRVVVPEGYGLILDKVMSQLRNIKAQNQNSQNQLFFQHGDEICSNFLLEDKTNGIVAIDPSPILTTRVERALNKLLGGSLLFGLEIKDDGTVANGNVINSLVSSIRRCEDNINTHPQDRILREIIFINLSRIFFGIYNSENASYFENQHASKFLKLAMTMFEYLS